MMKQMTQMKTRSVDVGSVIEIPAGTKVRCNGEVQKRDHLTRVKVRKIETTKAGNLKVFWKSNGYEASTVLKVS
jgi:hypothetical protein